MKFDTDSSNTIFDYNNEDLSFILNKIIEIHKKDYASNDPAILSYRKILETLLLLNKRRTIEFIESIGDDYAFQIVSGSFLAMIYIFKGRKLVKKLEVLSKKFETSEYYFFIKRNIDEIKEAVEII